MRDSAVIDDLQGLVAEAASTPRERTERQYVIDAFRHKMPSLILFAFENESIIPHRLSRRVKYANRSSTPEELERILELTG